ncbi:hypothetical protein COO91_02774 [Nostoc flagelliforme CCNUN1]|uniref:Uncharacterized protein n=1 Tax=Nostoc flagelliforme CCNUN1 TaxID=2038116 RepID=A0A2K8SN40_9NOSO|nr:hypothetical protein COO91_02774 [Nostoc flagelliforme CCNUN1]
MFLEQTNQYYQELGDGLKPRLIVSSKFWVKTYHLDDFF